jgi:hypothetical protein
MVLGQTELFQGCASSDLNLGSYDIDTRDFLGDGVLDLTVKSLETIPWLGGRVTYIRGLISMK